MARPKPVAGYHPFVSWLKSHPFFSNVAGILVCSVIAFSAWVVANGIAWSPIINRPDDMPRTEEGLPFYVRLCGLISDVMGYPFTLVPKHSIFDGPQIFVLAGLFWGFVLYVSVRAIFWTLRQIRTGRAQH